MNENQEINVKRNVTILCIFLAVIVVGTFVVLNIQQRNKEKLDAAVASRDAAWDAATSSPEVKTAEDYGIEIIYDGVIGNEPEEATEPAQAAVKPTTSPTGEADDNPTTPAAGTPAPKAPVVTAAPAAPTTGTGSSPAEGTEAGTDTTPAAPATQAPIDGSTNSAGQVYDPVFGWTTPTGGVSTPSHGNGGGSEQIGTMG